MKNKLIYFGAVLLSVVLLALGYFYVSRGTSSVRDAPEAVSNYYRCEVISVSEPEVTDHEYYNTTVYAFCAVIESGEKKGEEVTAIQSLSDQLPVNPRPVSVGDDVIVYENYIGNDMFYSFAEYVRSDAIIILILLFSAALILFGGMKGLKTLVSLVLTVLAVFFVLVPAVLNGENIYLFSILVCLYITVMTFVIVNGISHMSLVATIGCLGGVVTAALLTLISDSVMGLTGVVDDGEIYLMFIGDGMIDIKALLFGSILIGSIGAVMDVAINMAASLHEVALKIKKPTFRELYKSGVTIGRDMIGTMANTLILAYIGSSLCTVLLIIYNNSSSPLAMFNKESLVIEILNILIGSFGILSALPLTAAVAALFYSKWDKTVLVRENVDCKINLKETTNEYEKDEYVELLESINND